MLEKTLWCFLCSVATKSEEVMVVHDDDSSSILSIDESLSSPEHRYFWESSTSYNSNSEDEEDYMGYGF